MRQAVICEPLRTSVGRYGGVRTCPPTSLAATVVRGLLDRTGLPPQVIDDAVFGHVHPTSEAPAFGRLGALDAGPPVEVTGFEPQMCRPPEISSTVPVM